jgi:hypothetical protein
MSIITPTNFNVQAQTHIDTRLTQADITARDAISTPTRYWGMQVHVLDSDGGNNPNTYILQKGTTSIDIFDNGNWIPVSEGWALSGTTTLTGNTTIDGGTNVLIMTANGTAGQAILGTNNGSATATYLVVAEFASGAIYNLRNTNAANTAYVSLFADLDNNLGTGAGWFVEDDRATPRGLEYFDDYTGTFTTRSLIDKGFADGAYWSLTGTSTLTGNVIVTGGTTPRNITLETSTSGGGLAEITMGESTNKIVTFRASDQGISTGNEAEILLTAGASVSSIEIIAGTNSARQSIYLQQNTGIGIRLLDTRSTSGLYYDDNYSTNGIANHGNRWIPDKGYADGAYILNSGTTNTTAATIITGSESFNVTASGFAGITLTGGAGGVNLAVGSNQLSVGATGAIVTLEGTDTFRYASDTYRANFIDTSLIDKGYADGAYLLNGATTTLSADTRIDGVAKTFDIEMTTTGKINLFAVSEVNTKFDLENTNFNVWWHDTAYDHYNDFNVVSNGFQFDANDDPATTSASLYIYQAGRVDLYTKVAGNERGFRIDTTNKFKVTDAIDTEGMYYAADYSTNGAAITDGRWIPDKAYNDSAYAPISEGIKTAHIQLSQSQVDGLNASPITIVAAPASGQYIQVIGASAKLTHVTTAFTGGDVLQLRMNGASLFQTNTSFITAGVTNIDLMKVVGSGTPLVEATALVVQNNSDSSGGGASTIDVYVQYVIIDTN